MTESSITGYDRVAWSKKDLPASASSDNRPDNKSDNKGMTIIIQKRRQTKEISISIMTNRTTSNNLNSSLRESIVILSSWASAPEDDPENEKNNQNYRNVERHPTDRENGIDESTYVLPVTLGGYDRQ